MFKHFQNLFRRQEEAGKSRPGPPPSALAVSASGPAEAETAELDILYRQALDAMDIVESGCRSVAEELPDPPPPAPAEKASPASGAPSALAEPGELSSHASPPGVQPQQVLEAALFVGGMSLTLKRLCFLLRDEFSPLQIETFLEELNAQYRRRGCPYEIRFGEGGYRMSLRSEFDDVRHRVYGLGPREFKLSRDALEVLSLIAYQQPLSAARIADLRGNPSREVLRQLLRRALIVLERSADDGEDVHYRTTERFLQAFGLASLDDLPQPDDLAFK